MKQLIQKILKLFTYPRKYNTMIILHIYSCQNMIQYNVKQYVVDYCLKKIINKSLNQNNSQSQIMGFKANIDIALSFSSLKICSVRQQGRIKFRICLYYTTHNDQGKTTVQQIQFCHPYSILRKNNQYKNSTQTLQKIQNLRNNNNHTSHSKPTFQSFNSSIEQSQLDLSSDYYISKPFKMMFQRQNHPIMQTCCFRTYIDTQKYSDVNLKCQVDLMFCPNAITDDPPLFKTIGKCQCKVRKLFDISTYLPIVFDQFQGVVIQGIYQAALIDFRYQKQPKQLNRLFNPQNFHAYLKSITNGFNRSQTKNFYKYYRQLLQKQLFTIQERHYDLMRILGIVNNLQQFRILKVNPNNKIQLMIDNLGIYNNHSNTHQLINQNQYQHNNNQRSHQHISSTDSLSTNPDEIGHLNHGIMIRAQSNNNGNSGGRITHNFLDKNKQSLSQQIIYDFITIKAHIFKKWSDFLQFATKNITYIAQKYKTNYNSFVKQRLSGNVFSHKVNTTDWKKSAYDDGGSEHLKLAETDRMKIQKDEQLWKQAFLVENEAFFVKDAKNIKIFEEIFEINRIKIQNAKSQKILLRKSLQRNSNIANQLVIQNQINQIKKNSISQMDNSFTFGRKYSLPMGVTTLKMQQQLQGIQLMVSSVTNQNQDQEDHFIILVHGFQASRQDFIILKNCLEIRFKTKGRTDDDIQTQGKRLALELQRYLNDNSPSINYKLSFVGHSMGGVIIRTALCYLENVDRHLYTYISLSAPHLGYLYQPSTHIQAGLWFMNTWNKATSIEQICLRDKQDLRQCFLYRLSRCKTLDKFQKIALVGSIQDKYVPYQSARVELNQKIIQQYLSTQSGQIINQMIEGVLGTIQCKQLSRMDVIFNIQESNFDSMIGRTAHIRYLSDRQFIKVFCIVFDKFFK